MVMVLHGKNFQFCLVIIAVITLVRQDNDKKR